MVDWLPATDTFDHATNDTGTSFDQIETNQGAESGNRQGDEGSQIEMSKQLFEVSKFQRAFTSFQKIFELPRQHADY